MTWFDICKYALHKYYVFIVLFHLTEQKTHYAVNIIIIIMFLVHFITSFSL